MVLGEATSESTQYGRQDYTVKPLDGADLAAQLHEAVSHIRASYQPMEQLDLNPDEAPAETMPADPSVRNYSYTLIDGALWFRENSIMRKSAGLPAATEARIKGMVELRDCLRSLLDLEMDDFATDEAIAEKQKELSNRYDVFVAKHGQVNDRANELAFAEDTSYFLLCSLEEPEKDGKSYRKATDIFTKRTIKQQRSIDHVDTAAEALAVSIGQRAAVDLPFMAQLMGGEEFIPQIVEDLHGVIFKDPATGLFDYADGGDNWAKGWQPADEYLSGNVRRKLRQAQTAAKDNPFFEINMEALKRAQPRDLEASEIEVRLGSTWISPQIFEQFMIETFKTPSYHQGLIRVRYSPHTAEWFIENKSSVGYGDMTATNTYGTSRANAYEILEDSLNLRDVRVYDKVEEDGKEKRVLNVKETTLAAQKQQAIRDAFKDWLWKDQDRRDKLVKQYNEEMNSTRPREYDGQHLVFSGINPDIVLRDHQLNAIAHVIYGGNTMLAHEVGAGKTFEMVAAAMESKRLGLCSKSLFVVPNHLVSQWASEFLRLYPAANILVTTKRDFEPARRKKFCSRIATGDYDAVIIGQSQFEKIPISDERQRAFLVRQIEDITEALQETKSERGDRFSIKQLEKTKKSLEAKLEKLQGTDRKDSVVSFEELGVDRLFIDESDNYKNLFLYTKMRNVAGLSTSDAQKSSDLFNKCRYLDELTGNRGVIFATGTPISNSMTEMYTIHRYLQYDRLQEMGMGHFDCWASRFGETTTSLELAPEGTGYRARTRFAKFFNLPELMTFFREVADIKTADQLNLPTPEVEYHNVVAKPTDIQKEFVKTLSDRASRVHSGAVDPKEDNMLKITSDGRKLGLDQRLIDPLLPDEPGTKVNLCVENVLKYWREGEEDKLTQLIFCDVSTPSGRSSHKDTLPEEEPTFTNIYEDIRRKLIRGGMPAEQIAFIHDADNEKRKEELFSKMRSGEVRVLIGSTAKMGAGTNVQNRLIASHDLDCPWRPRDLTQRKGRIERQGNTNSKVHVCRYVTEGTFDAYLWQTIESKQKFISQIMTSKSPVRSCDDVDETVLSFAEIKALCAGDPRIKERMDLDVEVKKLRLMKADHNSKKYRIQDMLLYYYPSMIEGTEAEIRGLTHDMQTLAANPLPEESFVGMVVRGDKLSDKKNAGAALISACQEMVSKEAVKIGSYRGFDILASYDTWERQYKLTLKGHAAHKLTLGSDPVGNLVRMENALARMPERLETAKAQLENYRKQKADAAVEVEAVFPQEAELAEKSARLIELDTLLNLDGGAKTQEPVKPKKKHVEVR
ncbi:MAG: DEAD/DEAH box helicase family protein [Oscillospiraceae bacterium]|nr:DEAD/DEAH box helicase family protein [Oscillospiraceae bacterium]